MIVSLIYGICAERFHFFPYYQVRPIINSVQFFLQKQVSRILSPVNVSSNEAISPEYRTQKTIETALLPMVSETFKINVVENGLNLTAGGICRVKGSIIIVDRLGVLYQFSLSNNRVMALKWPELTNNYSQFLKSDKADSKGNFRVHGVLCVPIGENYET